MKYSELNEAARDRLDRRHDFASDRMREHRNAAEERWSRYLVLTNGGGAAVALGFIGTAGELGPRPLLAVLCVAAFAVGMVLTGLGLYMAVVRWRMINGAFSACEVDFLLDKISIQEFDHRLAALNQRMTKLKWLRRGLEMLAFIAFVGGLTLGAASIVPRVTLLEELRGSERVPPAVNQSQQ